MNPELHLSLDGEGHLHAQLTRALKQAILERRLPPAARLPATRELAGMLGVSRNTVLGAYEQLDAEGFIEGRIGSGSFVAPLAATRPAPRAHATAAPREPSVAVPRLTRFARVAHELRAHCPPGHDGSVNRFNLEYGLPLVTPALQSLWRRELARAAEDTDLDYPPAQGLPDFRRAIAGYLGRRRGLSVDPEDVLVVGGTQQALDLAVRVLHERGEPALLEEPHYQGTRQVLLAAGARVSVVPVDDEGLDVGELDKHDARLVFVTPSHQFPTGAVLSLWRRLALLDWARRKRAFIVEDDYDGEFRHDVRPLAALKALDRDGRVLYIGTFSKVMFPALRIGYLVAPPSLREPLRAAKWLADRGCPAIEQRALARLIESGGFERLLRRTGKQLALRRAALLDALRAHCGGHVEIGGASAGMHVALWLTAHSSGQVPEIIAACAARGVAVYPIAPYYLKHAPRAGLLLGYSGLPAADLVEGAKRLGAVLAALPPKSAPATQKKRPFAAS